VAVTRTSNFIAIFSALRELRVRIFVSLTNCFELTNGSAIFKSISMTMESGTSAIYLIILIENVCFPNFKYGVGFILQF